MISLLFLTYLLAMLFAVFNRYKLAIGSFCMAFILSLIWFKHHATDTLNILL